MASPSLFRFFAASSSFAASLMMMLFLTIAVVPQNGMTVMAHAPSQGSSSMASNSATSSSSTPLTTRRPPFVAHVDEAALNHARNVARQRHDRAVQQALQDYNTDDIITAADGDTSIVVDPVVATAAFTKYPIQAPGALPDFGDQLERCIHVSDPPLFSKDECDEVIRHAEEHFAARNEPWGMLPSGQYEISGVWIKDVPALRTWLVQMARQRLFPIFQRLYPDFVQDPADLCIDSAYLFKYTPETGRRTEVHTDCGCLSFTIALNSNREYAGGGTFFEGLQQQGHDSSNVLEMDVGQITMRPGGVKHAGCAIESGTRYIIGGFCMNRKKVEHVRMLVSHKKEEDHNNKDSSSVSSSSSDPEEERSLLEAALVMNPSLDTTYNLLANWYLQHAGNKSMAKTILQAGLQLAHPGSSELAYSLGCLSLQEQDYVKVVQCMEICLAMDDCDIDALNTLAQAYANLGDDAPVNAERNCYQRIVAGPAASTRRVAMAYCNLGVLSDPGTDAEIEWYQKSLKLLPNLFDAQYSLGAAYASRGQWKDAVDMLRSSIGNAPNDQGEMQALQALYRAAKHVIAGDSKNSSSLAPPTTSQQDIVERFQEVMGVDNYQKLASGMAQQRS